MAHPVSQSMGVIPPRKTDNLQGQFEDFKKYFNDKLSFLMSGTLEALNGESVDKFDLTKLKRNGNIQQFKFNLEIKAKIEKIASETKDKKTFKHLKGVIKSIDKQNKLIRLADKSEVGWLMVNEYVTDDLASDSGDDAEIRKAEKRAKEKIYKKRRQQRYRLSQPRNILVNSVQSGISSPYMQYPNNCQKSVSCGQPPAHVTHVEPPVTGEVNAQLNSTLPNSSRSDPMLIPSSSTVQCKEAPKSKKKQVNLDKAKKKNKLDETKVKYNDNLSYDAKNFELNEQFIKDCEDPFTNSQYENEKAEFTEGSEKVFVKGRLERRLNFWKDIGANDFILDIIENGYKLPLIQTPEPAVFKNNKSALANPDFVTEAIQELVSTFRVLEIPFRPKVVNPLSAASNKGKNRRILDLRYVNLHLWKEKTKFEDWKTFQYYLSEDGHMFKFDLKSPYHHISTYALQTYFRFLMGD